MEGRLPSSPSTGRRGGAAEPASAPATRSASRATVGASKSARTGRCVPNASATRAATRVARSEWPPSAKKSSSTPTRSTPSTSAQIPASVASAALRGAT